MCIRDRQMDVPSEIQRPREMDCCPDPTPFPTVPAQGCRMKPLSLSRKTCVLDDALPLCASSTNSAPLRPASPSPCATVLSFSPLSHPRDPRHCTNLACVPHSRRFAPSATGMGTPQVLQASASNAVMIMSSVISFGCLLYTSRCV